MRAVSKHRALSRDFITLILKFTHYFLETNAADSKRFHRLLPNKRLRHGYISTLKFSRESFINISMYNFVMILSFYSILFQAGKMSRKISLESQRTRRKKL